MLTFGLFQAHGSAAFLAWHRYFIHIYERKLKEQCGYTGVLTYETILHVQEDQKTGTD